MKRRNQLITFAALSGAILASALFFWPDTDIRKLDGLIFKTVKNPDGSTLNLTGQLFLPLNPPPNLPAVVVVHGGSWKRKRGDMENLCKALARAGFAAFNVSYRFAPQYLFPAPVEDVEAAISWLRAQAPTYGIDSGKISGWGYSAGAHLILMAGLNPALGLKAIVVGGAPTDFSAWPDSPIVTDFLGQSFELNQKLWRSASPIYRVNPTSPPVFLYHGEQDDLVEIYQMERMAEALKHNRIPFETYRVSGLGHIGVYFLSQESVRRGIDFIQHLSTR
jgi:acetyl esterase/lipase